MNTALAGLAAMATMAYPGGPRRAGSRKRPKGEDRYRKMRRKLQKAGRRSNRRKK